MKRIIDWHLKKLSCFFCGETRSVKFESKGLTCCNKCIRKEFNGN